MHSQLTRRRIVVTGGAGFVGQALVERLCRVGVPRESIFVPRRVDFDLTKPADVERLYATAFGGPGRIDVLIHLAAEVGGIGANQRSPGRYFYANMAMALHLIEGARLDGFVERGGKFVQVGTICSYPNHTPIPFQEDQLWNGFPEVTNAPYGIAKKAAGEMLRAYALQYGLSSAYVLPVNLYGPRDNFDPLSSHVIPALIRKCLEARSRKDASIVCWGTGSASREFLFVDDLAEALVRAAEVLEEPTPVNLGAGQEISIRDLVALIARLTGFEGRIEWDASRPDGQPRRCLDTTKAEKLLGWKASTSLEEGLAKTIAWYSKTS